MSLGQLILSVFQGEFSSYPFTKELKLVEVCFLSKAGIGLFLVRIHGSNRENKDQVWMLTLSHPSLTRETS